MHRVALALSSSCAVNLTATTLVDSVLLLLLVLCIDLRLAAQLCDRELSGILRFSQQGFCSLRDLQVDNIFLAESSDYSQAHAARPPCSGSGILSTGGMCS